MESILNFILTTFPNIHRFLQLQGNVVPAFLLQSFLERDIEIVTNFGEKKEFNALYYKIQLDTHTEGNDPVVSSTQLLTLKFLYRYCKCLSELLQKKKTPS